MLAFVVWVTDGRLAVFAAIGLVVALSSLILLSVIRARHSNLARLPAVAKMMIRPALRLGAVIGVAIEFSGRWSGGQFVIWRGFIGGIAVLVGGLILIGRASLN